LTSAGAIIHDQITFALDIHGAPEEAFISAVIGDYGIV
jgi:hypothetical protein